MKQPTVVPITALTGFLGSGKTTLLGQILNNPHGYKIGVVVNDYGDINIDAELVKEQSDDLLELTNGCMCCTLDSLDLDEAIEQFTHPSSPVDYIVIEASGLAEPADLTAVLRRACGDHARLDAVVAVLDAANYDSNPDSIKLAKEQVEHGDFVIINKADLVDQKRLRQAQDFVNGINSRTRSIVTEQARVDVRLLLDQEMHDHDKNISHQSDDGHHSHQHVHDHYSTFSFEPNQPLDPARFQRFVNQQIPTNLYRAKGFVDFGTKGEGRKYLFHQVGRRAELSWDEWGASTPKTRLVFIGRDLSKAQIEALLQDCIDPSPSTAIRQPLIVPRRS
ncbi:GTP-binding protein [Patescibacteria group bacterium]|nr:MAG: GTP-binding protein [Patescibacteria group bacterium]